MLPEDFVEYSKKFEVGFLGFIGENGLDIKLVYFDIHQEGIEVIGHGLIEGKACLAFANEKYVWGSENASVQGRLEKIKEGRHRLIPDKIVWTIGFNIKSWPRRIVDRWKSK